MIKKLLLITLTLFALIPFISGQIIFDKSNYNFGEIQKGDSLYVDFKLTNVSKKNAQINEVETPYGVNYRYTHKTILPDSTVLLRLYYIPKIKGEFNKTVKVDISIMQQPLLFTIKGNLEYADVHASQETPPFPAALTQKLKPQANATFNVIDANTKQPIKNADVKIIWDGVVYKELLSNSNGKGKEQMYLEDFYLVANAKGYNTKEFAFHLDENNQKIVVEMGAAIHPKPVIAEKPTSNPVEKPVNETPKITSEPIKKDTTPVIVEKLKPVVQPAELNVNEYKPINVVFLIDRSGSMAKDGRLDLLKASMIQLLKVLRPIDKIAVVAYSKESKTIVPSQFVKNKDAIRDAIRKITAGGNDRLDQGIKIAYNLARFGHIKNGNNMIIMATDGGSFSITVSPSTYDYVKNKTKTDTRLSVIAVKAAAKDISALKKMAKSGNGDYIEVNSYNEALNNLVDEVKKSSLKRETGNE